MTVELANAVLWMNYRCTCGAPRWQHAGKKGGGRCLGHALPVSSPALNATGRAALGDGQVPASLPADAASTHRRCPTGCARFRWDPDDRLMRRAVAAADDEPKVALRAYHGRRNRRRTAVKVQHGAGYSVGPSDHSSCLKAIEFRERPPEGHVPLFIPKDEADVGTMLHEEMTRARRLAYPWRRFKVPVLVPGLDRPGEADEVDPIIGRVTDYKSAGDWKWEQIGKDGPPESEWKQLATYAFGIADTDLTFTPVDLELVYINREKGWTERFLRPYDEGYARAAVLELVAVLDALEEGRELPRERAGDELLGPTVNALCARYCPHVRTCWDLPNVPAERTPEGWLYARDDQDGAISTAVEVYDANRSEEAEAKKQKDYARVLLAGVEPGEYGEFTLKWTGGNLSDPKPDKTARLVQVEAELDAARAEGRPPVDLPYPTVRKRSNTAIQVKRIRAARVERERRQEMA